MYRALILILAAASFFTPPFASALYVEVPDYHSGIASTGVKDTINGRYGDVIFATDGGISVYTENGTWYSVNARNPPGETAYGSLAPLETMVTAVALDPDGRLWLGYRTGFRSETEPDTVPSRTWISSRTSTSTASHGGGGRDVDSHRAGGPPPLSGWRVDMVQACRAGESGMLYDREHGGRCRERCTRHRVGERRHPGAQGSDGRRPLRAGHLR